MFGQSVLTVFLIYLLQCSGWQYCSDTNNSVHCVPCRNDGTDRYKCPRQCGRRRHLNLCDQVCGRACQDSECEYGDDRVSLRCVNGCTDFYTGPACLQKCKDGCITCDQQTGQCIKCSDGRYGVDCAKSCMNCKSMSCDQADGRCTTGCQPGFYGNTCNKRCNRCQQCGQNGADCITCDRNNGTCLHGCADRFYGPQCTKTCPDRCLRCDRDTGSCAQCETGWAGVDCDRQTLPEPVTPKHQHGDKPTEDVTTKSGLMSIFEDQDYLLPVVGCALVFLIIVAVVILWRCKRRSKSKTSGNEEEGKCGSVPQHPSVHRLVNWNRSDPRYDEIVDDIDGMKKRLLEDRALPRIPTPENKPLACLRNRSGNLSAPYMSPIVEAVEEEEEEEQHETTPNVVFTVEPPSDEEATGDRDSLASDDQGAHVHSPEFGKRKGSFDNDTETGDGAEGVPERHVDLLDVPGSGIFIFQNGSIVENGSYGDYGDSCNSGLSTPKVPDMYLHNTPGSSSQLVTNIAEHLDKYLSQRQATTADLENEVTTPLQNGASDTGVSQSNVLTGNEQQSETNSNDKRRLNSEVVPQNEHMPAVHNGTSDTSLSGSDVLISAKTDKQNEKNNNAKRRFKSKLPLPKSKTKYNHKSFVPKRDTRRNADASENDSMLNHTDTIDC
ncbi:uncharacterized protein [Haliotis asinina]|uniref:uncharacterized protein n=1 Tax=Haliotis asinina TaxID=109174 RepID=UPI003531F00B